MTRFKFYIMYEGRRTETFAVSTTLTGAFDQVIDMFPNCIYINHWEVA